MRAVMNLKVFQTNITYYRKAVYVKKTVKKRQIPFKEL